MTLSLLIMIPIFLMTLTPIIAHATNESSYKTGYNGAFDIFRCLATPTVSNECDGQGYTFNQYDVCTTSNFRPVSNMTACADGYADGFARWCASDVIACSKQVRADAIPHMLEK